LPWATRQILVTVKTYPNPSKKYQETVCVAGIDVNTHEWLRLYPVPFRDLKTWQQFKKYSVISVNVTKATDHRPESHKIDPASIKVVEVWDTKKGWGRREEVVFQSGVSSMCEVQRQQKAVRKSLGVVRPIEVGLEVEPVEMTDDEYREMFYRQADIFRNDKTPIERIPLTFKYAFGCLDEPSCTGHKLSIIDWEIMQLYRRMRDKYRSAETAVAKVKEQWLDNMCGQDKNTHFYVGNMMAHPASFLVLGVFWPPAATPDG